MKEICFEDTVVAIYHPSTEWKNGLDFLTADSANIQVGTWWYDDGKVLKAHRHKINPRKILNTQEVILVVSGALRIDLYTKENTIFYQQIVKAGDIFIILDVGHGYEILDKDTKVIEVKNGPFTSVELDKEMI